jgi:hypothetical protein
MSGAKLPPDIATPLICSIMGNLLRLAPTKGLPLILVFFLQ